MVILLTWGLPFAIAASDYPSRPIELVVANPPGGGSDSGTTLFKENARKILGQPIISNYKTGAGGALGTAFAANAKPDGYTLIAATHSSFILLPLTKDPGYELESFTQVCNFTESRLVFCVKEDSPYKTIADFLEAAKTKKMKYASTGTYTTPHIIMELFSKGIRDSVHPYSKQWWIHCFYCCPGRTCGHWDSRRVAGDGGPR